MVDWPVAAGTVVRQYIMVGAVAEEPSLPYAQDKEERDWDPNIFFKGTSTVP